MRIRTIINTAVLLLLCLMISGMIPVVQAEEKLEKGAKVIPLWPGKVPLQQENPKNEERWAKWGLVDVHTPSLTVYEAKPEESTKMAILVIPGGGYGTVCMNHEGHRVAKWFSSHGVTAFVLKYRMKPYKHPVPLMDAQQAMRYIRSNAEKYHIDSNKIGVIGFSAGGHLAASLSVHYNMPVSPEDSPLKTVSARPDFSILVYPVISMDPKISHGGSMRNLIGKDANAEMIALMSANKQITKDTPPAFLVHGSADKGVKPINSELYKAAMEKNQVPVELLMVEGKGHGFGLNGNWAPTALEWVKKHLSASK